ncbi:HrgA protein [Rhodobacteraceae bacterium XHP0102]|nr:HrgA protein [Rhodobacteraceae bacterium XHP0102]
MALNLLKTVADFLQTRPEEKFTAREIAQWIFDNFPDECQAKRDKSKATVNPLDSDAALILQISSEIGARRPQLVKAVSGIKTTEGRPRRYYFSLNTDLEEIEQAERQLPAAPSGVMQKKISEHDLYPRLSEFLLSELNVYSCRIDERRSSNTRGAGGNRWLYPDLVGMEDLSAEWDREIKDCVKQYADKKTKLWSFEVKLLVNRSNVREVFFQAVSNSAWANFGYLVASEISGYDTLKELRMLSSLHGIGFIKLDANNAAESQIIIPARERAEVDWDAANRLTKENRDFREYVIRVRQFYQTGEMRPRDWDAYDAEV